MMLVEQENQIYKYFVELVRDCNLMDVMSSISEKEPLINDVMINTKFEHDYRHNNRIILFHLIKAKSGTVFYRFAESLREHGYYDLANKLENKSEVSARVETSNRIPILNFLMVLFMKFFPVMM